MRHIVYYTATIITFDGGDTTADGEPCEPGHGYRESYGWWNPDHGYWTVHPQRERAIPDLCPQRADPARWLAGRLAARLGSLDHHLGHTFVSAREAIHPGRLAGVRAQQPGMVLGIGTLLGDALAAERLRPPRRGQRTLTAAAHAHGFPDDVLAAAVAELARRSVPQSLEER